MNTTLQRRLTLGVAALFLFFSAAGIASAQVSVKDASKNKSVVIERTTDDDGEEQSVKIEMKDGRTWVNGTEVPEGEDIADYLPEGFDVSVLDRDSRRGRLTVRDRDDRSPRGMRFSADDDDEDVTLWFDDEDGKRENKFVIKRGPDALGMKRFEFNHDLDYDFDLEGLRDNLVEVGGNWGSRALGFFGDFGSSPSSPEIMQKEIDSKRLAKEIASADGSKREDLSRELDELLSTIFDEKTALREERVQTLQEKLELERDIVSSRKRNRSQIIADRKAELTGKSKQNDW